MRPNYAFAPPGWVQLAHAAGALRKSAPAVSRNRGGGQVLVKPALLVQGQLQ